MVNGAKRGGSDEYYTPVYAVLPIIGYLVPKSVIWCPFDLKQSNYVKVFREHGFKVKNSHISKGYDFFNVVPPKCDYIISNPPYSLKTKVLKRLYKIGIPFAMLFSTTGLFESERYKLAEKYGAQVLFLDKRISFITDMETGKIAKQPFTGSCYWCYNILPQDLMFGRINKNV